MSQHDYSLADQAGAAFRSDLNSALDASVTGNSGATEPATKFARMVWLDTTANLAKQRNAANSVWFVRGTLAETLGVSRSSNTILAAADHGKYFVATGNFTQTLTAVATLADKWVVAYRVNNGVTITLDPDTTETIDGATTKVLVGPCSGLIFCTGAAFLTYGFDSPAASATVAGVVELATNAETLTGTDPARAVTPAGLASVAGLVKLNSGTVSAAATLDIVMTGYTAFKNKLLVLTSFLPVTDTAALLGRVSTDGGATFDTGSSTYRYAKKQHSSSPGSSDAGGTDSSINIASSVGGGAGEPGCSAQIVMYDTTRTSRNGLFTSNAVFNDGQPETVIQVNHVERLANQDTDAFQVLFSSGNIASGDWVLYGYN